jgi:thiamine-monophosphate kinase
LARRLVGDPDLHAMMDLSDGLSLDLHRLCVASSLRAELSRTHLEAAISSDARTLSSQDGRPALEHALSDGEDFELLVCGGERLAREELGLICVGRLESVRSGAAGVLELVTADGSRQTLEPKGYEHFR